MRPLLEVQTSDRFAKSHRTSEQFADLYFTRNVKLAQLIIARDPFGCPPESHILNSTGETWCIGTVFRHMENKPSIINDTSLINHGQLPTHSYSYSGPNDKIYLQPEYGRPIPLKGEVSQLMTGCVVGMLGTLVDGTFHVKRVEPPSFTAPPPPPAVSGKILFISGTSIENDTFQQPSLGVFLDYLSGYLDSNSASVSQLVICGNSLKEPPAKLVGSRITRPVLATPAIFEFVRLIQSVARDLPVHLMPGETDPAASTLPQKPFHRGLFASAADILRSESLWLHTNPAQFSLDTIKMLGTSGQPVLDMLRYSTGQSAIELLCKTLDWRHLAPTAPDTLAMYPFTDTDPLVLDEIPNVYFAGNMPEYASTMHNGVRVICVPSFAETGQVVELDLATLETQLIAFR